MSEVRGQDVAAAIESTGRRLASTTIGAPVRERMAVSAFETRHAARTLP
jgi:hypothetical protein